MAFFEELFPAEISRDAVSTPRFRNSKAYMPSGQRITNALALLPLHDFTVSHPIKTGADFEMLRAFFYVVGADRDGFRFQDWSDYKATFASTSLTLIAGETSVYQMNRLYTYGARTFVRPIYKPVAGVVVQRNRSGVLTNATSDCSISTTTGRVTVNTGHMPGDIYTWAGQFHVPVAFKDPAAAWRVFGTSSMLTEWAGIELEETREIA